MTSFGDRLFPLPLVFIFYNLKNALIYNKKTAKFCLHFKRTQLHKIVYSWIYIIYLL